MVLCDWCEQGCHLACHNPPLAEVPEADEWFCPKCHRVASYHLEAQRLRDQFRNCLGCSGISDEDMLNATAALLNGETADPADANNDVSVAPPAHEDSRAAVHVAGAAPTDAAGAEARKADEGAAKEVCFLQASFGERQHNLCRKAKNCSQLAMLRV